MNQFIRKNKQEFSPSIKSQMRKSSSKKIIGQQSRVENHSKVKSFSSYQSKANSMIKKSREKQTLTTNRNKTNSHQNQTSSKVKNSKYTSGTQSNSLKIHQPLTINQNNLYPRGVLKESKFVQSSLNNMNHSSSIKENALVVDNKLIKDSRQKIQAHLENKQSYVQENINPISFRKQETNMKKSKASQKSQDKILKKQNESLMRELKELKDKYLMVQQMSLEDKEKIKNLISRISQLKREKSHEKQFQNEFSKSKTTASYAQLIKTRNKEQKQNTNFTIAKNSQQTPYRGLYGQANTSQSKYSRNKQFNCQNPQCEERKKYLENELYKERIKRDQLQKEKQEWEVNRNILKRQYQQLLGQIQTLRQDAYEQEQN